MIQKSTLNKIEVANIYKNPVKELYILGPSMSESLMRL